MHHVHPLSTTSHPPDSLTLTQAFGLQALRSRSLGRIVSWTRCLDGLLLSREWRDESRLEPIPRDPGLKIRGRKVTVHASDLLSLQLHTTALALSLSVSAPLLLGRRHSQCLPPSAVGGGGGCDGA